MGNTFFKSFLLRIKIAIRANLLNNIFPHHLRFHDIYKDNIHISYTKLSSNSDYIYGDATHIPVVLPETQKQRIREITQSLYHKDNSKPETQSKRIFKNYWSDNGILLNKIA